jgi:predicted phage-related endonuclease
VQQQLYVTGLRRAWLAVLIGGNEFRVYDIEANERFQTVLVKQLTHFWSDYVLTGTPPPVDGSTATTRAIALLHPQDTGAEIELEPDAWLPKLEQLERIKNAKKRLDEKEDLILNELKSVIADSTFANIGDKTLSLKTQTRKEHLVKESTYRVLRIGKRK